jgi:hypothetical protein
MEKSSAACAVEVALRAAITEDERRQGRSLTPREREAFSRAFLAESRKLAAWKVR